ncbi:hypothetical protein CFC21_051316 [Triticum aestivum]|uniref:Myb/SANT-like domain-containing protein n=1 Tax=Triticum aestivum TaxID=4565 RepID=A0A9R1G6Y0_WHEAT|nr:hypothetical protein CFC21_051316 [Triticum aestivum]
MAEGGGKKFGRNYLTWTDEMDTTLLEVLVEHHNNGDHAQNEWKSHVYSAVIGNVREKCSVTITKENISSRCKTFEKHYEAISKMLSQANKKVGFYKNRVIKNWDAITTIYSKDHANGEGAVTGAETVVEPTTEPNEASPEMKGSFHDALKSLEPLPLPQVTPPAEILATLEIIPDLARGDILRSYGKMILSERLYQALLELPMNFRKEWLLMLN